MRGGQTENATIFVECVVDTLKVLPYFLRKLGVPLTIYRFNDASSSHIIRDCINSQWRTQEFCWGGSTNSVEDRENGDLGAVAHRPLVRGSGGNCNLVQEISFHIVKFS